MAVLRKRGRPRQKTEQITPELLEKHAQGLTLESIDLLLKRSMITQSQHWAANHFRWLHSMRYGIAKPRQVAFFKDDKPIINNPEFVADLVLELLDAEHLLKQYGTLREINQIAVFNERPKWLGQWLLGKQTIESQRFAKGLELLESIF